LTLERPLLALIPANGSEPIHVTGDHKIWSEDRDRWVPARDLYRGERLRSRKGELIHLLTTVPLATENLTYDLEVETDHRYFVTHNQILVHNCNKVKSRIKESTYAKKLAQKLSDQAQNDVDHLILQLKNGNIQAGKGFKPITKGYIELRGENAGRVIIKQVKDGTYEVVGKFTGHKRGPKENSRIIMRLIEEHMKLTGGRK